MTHLYLHGFGTRYGLPVPLALYLYAAGAVVVLSFVLVVLFARGRVGEQATAYPRWEAPWLVALGSSPVVQAVGAIIGLAGLLIVIVTGLFGSQTANQNPEAYLVWVYFWAAAVILTGLIGNFWTYLNPFTTLYRLLAAVVPVRSRRLPEGVGIWPACALFFAFAWLELASGQAAHPAAVAGLALAYTILTVAGMLVYGASEWLNRCEMFTVLLGIVARFGPVETARDESGRLVGAWLRPWGAGLLAPVRAGWDWIVFVILMLSSLAFDGVIGTPWWNGWVTSPDGPLGSTFGSWSDPVQHTIGLTVLTGLFLLVFLVFMRAVMALGGGSPSLQTLTTFALTLVPIALVYNAAHNYTYVTVTSQGILPALSDPFGRGWHLLPVSATFTPNTVFAQAAIVWYAQVILIVVGHVIAVYLSHLRAGQAFKKAQAVLVSQYPMLILMVAYTMTSLWILAQPITSGG